MIDEQLTADPYPLYAQWRAAGDVLWVADLDHWFVLGHRAAMRALREPALASPAARADAERTHLQQELRPELLEPLRPFAESTARELLETVADRAEADVVADLAGPLAIALAGRIIGLPAEHVPAVTAWAAGLARRIAPPFGHCHRLDPSGQPRPIRVQDSIAELLVPGAPALIDLPDRLRQEILVAAHASTVGAIGNGVRTLLDHPAQHARLLADPALLGTAVEELLRFDPPTQMVLRTARADLELGGERISAGQTVVVVLAAANRDPDAFDDPDLLDLSRTPNHHLSFSRGTRMCLGSPVARIAAAAALAVLSARYPDAGPGGEAERNTVLGGRSFARLPIKLGKESAA